MKPIIEVVSVDAPMPDLARCEICGHRPRAPKFEQGKWVIRCSWCSRERKAELLAACADGWNGLPAPRRK